MNNLAMLSDAPPKGDQQNLLIVDDDERLRNLLKKYLQKSGYMVIAARDAAHARSLMASLAFDLMIVDVMMPGEDGFALTSWVRETSGPPVLLLTAKGDTEDRIRGLEIGADDYMSKPFEPRELLLRLGAILRRIRETPDEGPAERHAPPETLSLGAYRFDIKRAELWQGTHLVKLTTTEIAVMRALSSQPHHALSRQALLEAVGGGEDVAQERAIDVQITRLRRKIEDNPKTPRYLQTVRGAGYMLTPD